jgi:hypothetical protein
MLDAIDRFRHTFRSEPRGLRVRATIREEKPARDDRLSGPYLRLSCGHAVSIFTGEVLRATWGTRYLLSNQEDTRVVKTFRAHLLEQAVAWVRNSVVSDPVTGLQRSAGPSPLGDIWVTFEVGTDITSAQFTQTGYRLMTGSAVIKGDYVDGRRVTEVIERGGVRICHCE